MNWDLILSVSAPIIAVAVAFGIQKARQENDAEKFHDIDKKFEDKDREQISFRADVWREIEKIRQWRHEHERESSQVRISIEKQFTQVVIQISDVSSKFQAIMERIEALAQNFEDMKIDNRERREEDRRK